MSKPVGEAGREGPMPLPMQDLTEKELVAVERITLTLERLHSDSDAFLNEYTRKQLLRQAFAEFALAIRHRA